MLDHMAVKPFEIFVPKIHGTLLKPNFPNFREGTLGRRPRSRNWRTWPRNLRSKPKVVSWDFQKKGNPLIFEKVAFQESHHFLPNCEITKKWKWWLTSPLFWNMFQSGSLCRNSNCFIWKPHHFDAMATRHSWFLACFGRHGIHQQLCTGDLLQIPGTRRRWQRKNGTQKWPVQTSNGWCLKSWENEQIQLLMYFFMANWSRCALSLHIFKPNVLSCDVLPWWAEVPNQSILWGKVKLNPFWLKVDQTYWCVGLSFHVNCRHFWTFLENIFFFSKGESNSNATSPILIWLVVLSQLNMSHFSLSQIGLTRKASNHHPIHHLVPVFESSICQNRVLMLSRSFRCKFSGPPALQPSRNLIADRTVRWGYGQQLSYSRGASYLHCHPLSPSPSLEDLLWYQWSASKRNCLRVGGWNIHQFSQRFCSISWTWFHKKAHDLLI